MEVVRSMWCWWRMVGSGHVKAPSAQDGACSLCVKRILLFRWSSGTRGLERRKKIRRGVRANVVV